MCFRHMEAASTDYFVRKRPPYKERFTLDEHIMILAD